MTGMYWTGPDGITRIIQPNAGPPADYIGNAPNQFRLPANPMDPTIRSGPPPVRTGLPMQTYNPRMLPVVQQPPGLPATAPQFNPGTGFTMGQGGPAMSAGRPGPLQLGYSGAGAPPMGGGPSVPSGGGIPEMPSLMSKIKNVGTRVGGPLMAFQGTQMLADAAGATPTPDQYGAAAITDPMDPMAIPKLITGALYNYGNKLTEEAQSPDVSPAGGKVREFVGGTLTSPVRLGAGMHNATDDLSKYLSDNLFKSKGELQAERDAIKLEKDNKDAAMVAANADQIRTMAGQTQLGQQLMAGLSGDQLQTFDLGPAQTYFGDYNLPEPPPAMDYSGVQEAIDKTKPLDPTKDIEERRKGAILTGLVGGLLTASMDSDAGFSEILGSAGLGVMQGIGAADKYKAEATEKFKKAMDDYWIRTAGVRQNQAESDHQYASRVWETKAQQMGINAAAALRRAQAGELSIRQSGDKFFVEETVGGRKQLRQMDMGVVNRLAGFRDTLINIGIPEDQAKSMTADMAMKKDPVHALQLFTLAQLKSNGNYLTLIEAMQNDPNSGKDFKKAYDNAGRITEGIVTDETMAKKLADRQRDMFLIQAMSSSPLFFQNAMNLAGVR